MTHTEIVHVYFGAAIVLLGVAALVSFRLRSRAWHATWAAIASVIGFMLFIPVEDQSCSYARYGWAETLASAMPYAVDAWAAQLSKIHVVQHKVGGLLTMLIGAIELWRALGRPTRPIWGRLLPWFSIAIGLTLGIHGGTSEHLPHGFEVVHHWVFGACFVLGGVLLAAHQAGTVHRPAWRDAWAVLLIVAGLDLAALYRLPSDARVNAPDCGVENPSGAPQHLHGQGSDPS